VTGNTRIRGWSALD